MSAAVEQARPREARAGARPGTLGAALLVAREELRASLRDKQTALYTLLLPLVLYPVLFWAMIQGWLVVQGLEERTEVRIALASEDGRPPAEELVRALEGPAPLEGLPRHDPVIVERVAGALDEEGARALFAERGRRDPGATLAEGSPALDGLLLLDRHPSEPARLFHDGTRSRSRIARERARARLGDEARRVRERSLAAAGLGLADVEPFELDPPLDVARGRDVIAFVLSFVLPILVVVMTVMGAFFPAVDLSAGERERGTLETTLLLPVPRRAVHQGKLLAVGATAVIACLLNLLALGLSAGHLLGMLAPTLELSTQLPWMAFLAVLPLLLLFACFAAAVLTGVASLARTFQEGQALLGPVQLVFLLPAMAGVLPGLALDPRLALIPVVNVVLAFRSLLRGELLPLEYLLTALSLLACAVLASLAAERLLARETRLGGGAATKNKKRAREARAT